LPNLNERKEVMRKIRKGDTVAVIAGKELGKTGKVLRSKRPT
jgi:ribosomal protein L24